MLQSEDNYKYEACDTRRIQNRVWRSAEWFVL